MRVGEKEGKRERGKEKERGEMVLTYLDHQAEDVRLGGSQAA